MIHTHTHRVPVRTRSPPRSHSTASSGQFLTHTRTKPTPEHTHPHQATLSHTCSFSPVPQDGQFRWNRLENLLREGSKSADFDPSQLWLLAEWLLSPGAAGVRSTIVAELGRVIDAAAAADVRQRIATQ